MCAARVSGVCCLGMSPAAKGERTGSQRCYPHARHEVLNCVQAVPPPHVRFDFPLRTKS